MKTREEFEQFYTAELRPKLAELETQRRRIVRSLLLVSGACVAVFLIVWLVVAAQQGPPAVLVFVAIAAVAVVALSAWAMTKEFAPRFKRQVIEPLVRFIDPGLRYAMIARIPESRFREGRLFQRPDRYRGDDYVSGKIGETPIEFSEVHAEYKTHTHKGQTQWHTIFWGLYVVADFNKNFRTTTVVVPDVAEQLLGGLGRMLQKLNFTRPGELVTLEDPEFERRFAVYGEDQVEARYILSPSLMSRIVDFADKTGRRIHLSFVRSNVHIAISFNRSLFEPRLFRSALDPSLVEEYFDDLELAVGIVDDLNLNTRIWSKA